MKSSGSKKLTASLPFLGALAFSLGTSVGWGSLVVTSNTYLAQAGPWGSVIGLLIGMLIMFIISQNYSYLMQIYPDAGGAYTYTKEVFGYDYGFMTAWFLALVYLSILWANATAIPLFFRNFVGDMLQFGRMYALFGYDVYLGETIVTIAAIFLIAFLCINSRDAAIRVMIGLVGLFAVGITIIFIVSMFGFRGSFEPGFLPDSAALSQAIKIAVISPWAFIGFESISHMVGEFTFKRTKIGRLLVVSVISTTLLYIFVTLMSVTAYPERYASWLEYIRDRGNLTGLEAFPAFYAADYYLGRVGVAILMASLFALVITSLIGNITALSRLFYALGKDKVLPARFGRLNEKGVPGHATFLIACASVVTPFLGRVAIGWIVDVTTIGATLIYGLVSAAASSTARIREDKTERFTGLSGLLLMISFGLYILLPNLVTVGTLEKETYFLFIVWSVLGFLYFRYILKKDTERRFGSSSIVWVALLSLVLLISLIWMRQSQIIASNRMTENIRNYYEELNDHNRIDDENYIEAQISELKEADTTAMMMTFAMFGFAIMVMLSNHSFMSKHSIEHERQANTDPMTGVKSKNAYLFKEKEINAALEEEKLSAFSVVVCDVNGLKKINDTLGHKAGDEYICKASRMICEIFQHSPVYRVGGDEFVMILTGRDYENRQSLMQILHDRSVSHIGSGEVVVSGGISDFNPEEDASFHDVFQRADGLMYKEKQLLKGLGSISRDEEPEDMAEQEMIPPVLHVRRKLLIVEDEKVEQLLLGHMLKDEDYELLYASNGVEAMEQIIQYKKDLSLILMDLAMPRMSGMDVLRAMKTDEDLKDIPVIVLTSDRDSELECLRLGAMDFVSKPYPAQEIILARISKCIELSEDRDTIRSTERDSLTGLYNIDYFIRYVNMYDRHYEGLPMDALMVNINHFRMINERYGKQYGDMVLRRIADRIRQLAREIGGVACRQASDNFLMYCPHREDYQEILGRISEGISGEEDSSDRMVRLRMGVYYKVDKELDLERRFDRAMMAADSLKEDHAHSIGIFDSGMHEKALFKEKILEAFHSSIRQERFLVYFQPKFDIRGDRPRLASAEALVRWDHPEFGVLMPDSFIPVLEESGLVLTLDTYVWKRVAARIASWKEKYGVSLPVSVNVSRVDMLSPNLKNIFMDILDTYGLTTEDISLEVTESAYTGDSRQVISTARELQGMGMGFRIEMDDFGTGYSSLGILSNLPVDALKLDMAFVHSVSGDQMDVRMIQLIIDIADYLHVPVVAEGVETEEQLAVLKSLGCDYVQGYYFSRPLPAEEFEEFLTGQI